MSIEAEIFERGEREGIRLGVLIGRRLVLLALLVARFGELPAEISARLDAADGPLLDLWTDRVFAHATLAEVFAET